MLMSWASYGPNTIGRWLSFRWWIWLAPVISVLSNQPLLWWCIFQNIKWFPFLTFLSIIRWWRQIKPFHVKDKNPFILIILYHSYWCTGNTRSHGISRHGIVLLEYSSFSIKRFWQKRYLLNSLWPSNPYICMQQAVWSAMDQVVA